jgi:hypothetical protein
MRRACARLWVTITTVYRPARPAIRSSTTPLGIEGAARLVKQKDVRFQRKRPCDAEALLLSTGEPRGGFVQPVLHFIEESDFPESRFNDLVPVGSP